ncbi:hypothetical protein M2318_002901 [Metapseudomonas resinovorans]|uniref:hypothetical protein n=1 Tax=Metapseudomonas resinovorans TaxID=53412 RepID=UPI003D24E2FB
MPNASAHTAMTTDPVGARVRACLSPMSPPVAPPPAMRAGFPPPPPYVLLG